MDRRKFIKDYPHGTDFPDGHYEGDAANENTHGKSRIQKLSSARRLGFLRKKSQRENNDSFTFH